MRRWAGRAGLPLALAEIRKGVPGTSALQAGAAGGPKDSGPALNAMASNLAGARLRIPRAGAARDRWK